MIGLLTRLLAGALTPLTHQLSDVMARLLRKLALFFVAAVCLLVTVIALTVAFDLWIAAHFGAIAGALAVAALYLSIAGVAVVFATRKPTATQETNAGESTAQAQARAARGEQIDDFTAPVLAWLQKLGLRREQAAVLAGASIAKQLGPLPLVGLAIVAGFLIGRMAGGWRNLVPRGLLDDLLASGLFGDAGAASDADLDDGDADESDLAERDGAEAA